MHPSYLFLLRLCSSVFLRKQVQNWCVIHQFAQGILMVVYQHSHVHFAIMSVISTTACRHLDNMIECCSWLLHLLCHVSTLTLLCATDMIHGGDCCHDITMCNKYQDPLGTSEASWKSQKLRSGRRRWTMAPSNERGEPDVGYRLTEWNWDLTDRNWIS